MKHHSLYALVLAILANLVLGDPATDINDLEKQWHGLQQALKQVESQIESLSQHRREKRNATATTATTSAATFSTTSTTSTTAFATTQASSTPPTTTTTTTKLATTTTTSSEVPAAAEVASASGVPSSKWRRRHDARLHEIFIHNLTSCRQWDRTQLIRQLKVYGTYNPDFMAWDVSGVRRFLTKDMVSYDKEEPSNSKYPMFQKNVDALERMISDLELKDCDVKSTEMRERLRNITADLKDYYEYTHVPPFHRSARHKRDVAALHRLERDLTQHGVMSTPFGVSRTEALTIARLIREHKVGGSVELAFSHDDDPTPESPLTEKQEKLVGIRHVYECDSRGSLHEGYLRMCATCRGIRWMPKTFFPPFINEVVCDEEKSCLYFYDYPHGKCLQKNLNFQILQNIGTDDCQIWRKYNLNVPVCCECFVDHMSFFAKYV